MEETANYSKICLGICQVLAMFEIAIRIKQIEVQRKKKASRLEFEEDTARNAKKMRCWLHSLLLGTLAIAIVDILLATLSNKVNQGFFYNIHKNIVYKLNSALFFAITIGLVVSSVIVARQINSSKTFKRQVIKDKCAMYAMTFLFTVSYFLRAVWLITEDTLIAKRAGDCTDSKWIYINVMTFLCLLPITDLVPIVVILTYHICTMRNVPVY